jgi:hypothetical protein
MRALLAMLALALALTAAARTHAPADGRTPVSQARPDSGIDDDEEDRG